jgi:hypothetical protein
MTIGRRAIALLVAALLLLVTACGSNSDDESESASDKPTETASPAPGDSGPATYVAQEYSFEGPDTLPAGEATVRLQNDGKQPHEMIFIELLKGKTLDDVMTVLEKNPESPPPPWVRLVRSRAFAKPGKTDEMKVDLTAGSYVMMCFVPDKESKKPHAALGMVKPITVQ